MANVAIYKIRNSEKEADVSFSKTALDNSVWKFLAAVLLIVMGGLIYIFFRCQQTILNEIIGERWAWLQQCREFAALWMQKSGLFGEFVVYCLPGGLWALSYILFIDAFYQAEVPSVRLRLASAVPLAGIVSELLQACFPTGYMLGYIHIGNFDPLDLLCYLMPLGAYFLYLKQSRTKYNM